MAGCLMMVFLNIENLRTTSLVLSEPLPPVSKMIGKNGYDQISTLLRHLAAEQTRHYFSLWELAEFLLAFAVGGSLFLATQRRIFPMILCAMMLMAVAFQHFAVTPELAFRGRETDFPPGNLTLAPMARTWALQQVYFSVEVIKLLAGAVLASYLFVFAPTVGAARTSTRSIPPITAMSIGDSGPPDCRHRTEAFRHQQHAIVHARIHRVEGDHRIAVATLSAMTLHDRRRTFSSSTVPTVVASWAFPREETGS